MRVPKRQAELFKKYGRRDEDRHLTAAAVDRLRRDLKDLEENQRPHAVDELSRAREMGDLSENAAYHEAKARLGRIDGRIFSLKERIKNAVIIEAGPGENGLVQIGSTVVLSVGNRRMTYQIVGSQETDPSRGRISHLSPIGSAMIGRAVGDSFPVKTGAGETSYRIEEIK